MRVKTIVFVLVTAMIAAVCFPVQGAERDIKVEETANYIIRSASMPGPGTTGGEWAVIGVKRTGTAQSSYFDGYLQRLAALMQESGGDLGRKYTEYSRIAIALTELDEPDPYNLLSYINDYDKVIVQGINGPIFALEAKHSLGDTETRIRDKYISYILERQNRDGSFGLSEGVADTDVTAMAIAALSLYGGDNKIDRAVNRAFLYLSSVQLNDGSFTESPKDETASCESTAQVIIAMRRYGLPDNDRFFVKGGKSPLDALDSFRRPDGGYVHLAGDSAPDQMSAEQALLAMTEPQSSPRALIYDALWFDANQKYIESVR